MSKKEAVMRVEMELRKFVPYADWKASPASGGGLYGTAILCDEEGYFTILEHAIGCNYLGGAVGGWSSSAVAAARLLAASSIISTRDAKVFEDWYRELSKEVDRQDELDDLRYLAERLGYDLVARRK